MSSQKQTLLAIFSMIGSIILWTIVTDAWNYSALLFPASVLNFCKYLYSYLSKIVWMFPAFFLICRFNKNLFWNKKQLFSKPKAEPIFIIFLVLTTIYALTFNIISCHSWHMTSKNLLLLTIKFLIVGIGEETIFRGWGYNLLKKIHPNSTSLFISAFLFVVLHWPAYLIKLSLYSQFNWAEIIIQSISALFLGFLFTVMLERSGTLWNPIIANFYYD